MHNPLIFTILKIIREIDYKPSGTYSHPIFLKTLLTIKILLIQY